MIGEEIRRRRQEKGWTGVQLAEKAGMAPSAISQIETGRRSPHSASVIKLAEALGCEVANLYPKAAQLPLEERKLMDRPKVQEWLRGQGHMDPEEFLSWAEDLDLELDEDDYPQGIEDAIAELHQSRDRLLDALKTSTVRNALFPVSSDGLAGDEWLKATFRPGRLARELGNEIRHEYLAREVALVNYSKDLFVQGKTLGYLGYGPPTGQFAQERHQKMLEARRVLEESYAKVAAVG